jgi:hypothetical protein
MDKKLFPTCLAVVLCCLFSLTAFSAPVFADECNAPAPEDFRKVSEGPGYVTLSWEPVESGASHLLTVSEVLADGSEVIVQTFDGLFAVTKKVEGLKHRTRYKFRIYTRCADGTPSLIPSEVDIITLIIELTLAGRKPVNPQPVNCTGIEYNDPDYDWVGFRLQKIKGDAILLENYFEFQRDPLAGELTRIKRVETNNSLVAASVDGSMWPTLNNSNFFTENPFSVLEINEQNQVVALFGTTEVHYNYNWTQTVDLCALIGSNFSPYYRYETMISAKVEDNNIQGVMSKDYSLEDVKVNNPISNYLEFIIPPGLAQDQEIHVHIMNSYGVILKSESFIGNSGTNWIDMSVFPNGIYFVNFVSGNEQTSTTIIKI